jgi:ABC-type multidrug transport system ATPase subunit
VGHLPRRRAHHGVRDDGIGCSSWATVRANASSILDEPSDGIQPSIVEEIGLLIARLNAETGLTALLIEQNVDLIVACARRCLIMEKGAIVSEVEPPSLEGRLYRYYVCLGASRRGHDTCPVRSIAASEVEGPVLGQVRRLLVSPELVARTITAVERENGAAADAELAESEVIEGLAALEPVWAEQARIMRLLIERIDVAPDGIAVTLHAAGIRSLVAELADQQAPALSASEPLLEAAD